ncbi:MAG: Amuc_1100 family pilus-like protein [Verrucomicrobiae bacterium]
MNWFKENPFLADLAAVTLVGAGVLGSLIFQAALTCSESSEAYTTAEAKLHGLQNRVPFPSKENLKVIQTALDDYSTRIQALESQLSQMEIPLDEKITPQQFQDGLRTAVNDIRARADAGSVKLPDKFYFGFDQYQTQVPTEQAAPALFRQLLVIQSLVTRLVDFKVASVDSVIRLPLPEEAGKSSGTRRPDASESVLKRFPFDISFTAEQGKFRAVFNSLLGSSPFLIVRSLEIKNSNLQAPAKASGDPASKSADPLAATAGDNEEKKSLQVILGRELLKVALRLEMLDFAEPAATKK